MTKSRSNLQENRRTDAVQRSIVRLQRSLPSGPRSLSAAREPPGRAVNTYRNIIISGALFFLFLCGHRWTVVDGSQSKTCRIDNINRLSMTL